MKCLVTGVAGFIGSHLAERLIEHGHTVIGIDCLTDYYSINLKKNNLKDLLNYQKFSFHTLNLAKDDLKPVLEDVDWIFHSAAQPGVRKSWGTDFKIYTENNILATQKLLESLKGSKTLKKIVYASSSSIYGDAERLPTQETDLPKPISPYGVSKLAAEHLLNLYFKNYGIPCNSLRYFTVYGPRQRPDMAFNIFIRAILNGEELDVFGNGSQTRDFTFIDDVIDANIMAASTSAAGEVFNIGGGNYISLIEVVRILEDISGINAKVNFMETFKGDVLHTRADITKAKNILKYIPATKIEKGLEEEFKWLQSLIENKVQ